MEALKAVTKSEDSCFRNSDLPIFENFYCFLARSLYEILFSNAAKPEAPCKGRKLYKIT